MYTTRAENRRLTNGPLRWPRRQVLSNQRQLTFPRLTLPSERASEQLHARHVETAAVKELDNFHFGAQIVAKCVDEYSLPFRKITHANTELIDAGDERDQDWARQTGGQGAANVTRWLGALTRTTSIRAACPFAGFEAARGIRTNARGHVCFGGGPHHTSEIDAIVPSRAGHDAEWRK